MHARKGFGESLRKMGMPYVMIFKEHEKNYATHDLELEAIVHALKMWRHYLMGIKSELKTDYSGLKHLFEYPTLNSRHT
jgi:hypothetical protein